jgi:hypothetical protein
MPGMSALLASEHGVRVAHGMVAAARAGALGGNTGAGPLRVLPLPTPASFALDFAQMLQATAACASSCAGRERGCATREGACGAAQAGGRK